MSIEIADFRQRDPSGSDPLRPLSNPYIAFVAVLLTALGQAAVPQVAFASEKVALVIGNSAYMHVGQLPNPANDATDMHAALQRLGFQVTVAPDVDFAGLHEILRDFARRSASAAVALVFYAGHGMEVDGVNYLLPIDARLERDTDVPYETVSLDAVLQATEGASLRVVILDACRNNPLAAAMQTRNPTRSVSRGAFGALDERQLGDEMLVAYAAAAGTVAEDGTGQNSPYTTALLAHLERPLEIGTLFRRVRAEVLAATDGRQRPHEYQSLLREHYLASGVSESVAGAVGAPTAPSASADAALPREVVFWQAIRNSEVPADFREFLRLWPNGTLAGLATNRLERLLSTEPTEETTAPSGGGGNLPPTERDSPLGPAYIGDATGRRDLPTDQMVSDCDGCPTLVLVPAGSFVMGAPGGEAGREEDEGPPHQVEIAEPFFVGVYEVTFAEWEACTNDGGCSGRRPDDENWGRMQRPVIDVSWTEAQAYVDWLSETTGHSYRLLSEAEWEYVARAGTREPAYWYGEGGASCTYANSADLTGRRGSIRWPDEWTFAPCDDGFEVTAPVGFFGANPFGVHDMLGNVWEWVEDCWNERYVRAPDDGTAWERGDCGRRVVRGGAWNSQPIHIRAAVRDGLRLGVRSNNLGFRVARWMEPEEASGVSRGSRSVGR